jgi:glutaminase
VREDRTGHVPDRCLGTNWNIEDRPRSSPRKFSRRRILSHPLDQSWGKDHCHLEHEFHLDMDFQELLLEIQREIQPHFGKGAVADYIPALSRVDPHKFGMSITFVNGEQFSVGDAREPFSIQSISKIFTLMLAMSMVGDEVWTRVGKEPSGTAFNSLVQLEYESGVPRNPFINAGALVILDCVMSHTKDARRTIRDYARVLAQNFDINFNQRVALSERKSGFRNAALAYLLKSHGTVAGNVQRLLDAYCHLCALEMSCTDLSRAMLPLANRGVSPVLVETVLTDSQAKRINSLLLTCGMYDSVGSFAYRVGLPAKSGVGGGIVAVMPGEFAISVWSPELDRSGNSLVGVQALQLFAQITGKSVF